MGLDVSLKYCQDMDSALTAQEKCDEFSSDIWNKVDSYDSLSEQQRTDIRQQIEEFNKTQNCDDWGSSNLIQGIDQKSAIHPDHMFEVGYLRSSYNDGGINSVLRRLNCMDLYQIFDVTNDSGYYVRPNWDDCLGRVNQTLADMRMHMNGPMSNYDAIHLRTFGDGVSSAADALKLLEKELEKRNPGFGDDYSNRDGDWFLNGMTIVGAVKANTYGGGMFLLTKSETSNLTWYYQALEVTREMIEFVLSKPDPENYVLGWSA
jgi:hypothetical protein